MLKVRENSANIGILTFHCSDNFGAMLQAYGLKKYLCDIGMETDIIHYAPIFMTGRHWFIPYVPWGGVDDHKWCIWNMWNGMRENLRMPKNYWKKRKNMKCFRETFLVDKKQHKIRFSKMLEWLPYQYYVVGSDQIWNPEITCGLRKAYFGAFHNKHKRKIVSYAASIGGTALALRYDEEFARLIKHVDAVSVREEEAIPYIKRFYEGEVTAVLDPVFFLKKESWEGVEKQPERQGYIFVYITETNHALSDYVKRLSQEKSLSVVEVSAGRLTTEAGFEVDLTAGPAEFLGYIHKADYVVSNSFHALAFSIIYQKKFLAFLHSSRGTRIRNILRLHGLEDRLCQGGVTAEIDAYVDWEVVEQKTKENARNSGDFLIKNISG